MWIKFTIPILMICIFANRSFSQNKGEFSIEGCYGVNYNFFVKTYDEIYAPNGAEHLYLYHKNSMGTAGGIELKYGISQRARLTIGYIRSVNSKRRSGGAIGNDYAIYIDDFNLRHINNFYTLGYERPLLKTTNSVWFNTGLLYVTPQQQEITIDKFKKTDGGGSIMEIIVQDRNKKNSGLEEAGVFAGFSYSKPVGSRFNFGIKTRGYFLVSTGTFEAITLTPSLSYTF